MSETHPTRMDYDTDAYWRGASKQKLIIARCNECSHWIHPPRGCCPTCWSDSIGHAQPSGKATLYSYTIQKTKPGQPPLIMAWAELEEQQRLIVVGPLMDVAPESIQIGAKLDMQWIQHKNTYLPSFSLETDT